MRFIPFQRVGNIVLGTSRDFFLSETGVSYDVANRSEEEVEYIINEDLYNFFGVPGIYSIIVVDGLIEAVTIDSRGRFETGGFDLFQSGRKEINREIKHLENMDTNSDISKMMGIIIYYPGVYCNETPEAVMIASRKYLMDYE